MIAHSFTIPGLKLVSEANAHTHWRERQKRAKAQRSAALLLARTSLPKWEGSPIEIIITRIAPRELDSDNVVGSAKHVRDGIADALGVDDRDGRIVWRVEQRKGAPKEYGVVVEVRAVEVKGAA